MKGPHYSDLSWLQSYTLIPKWPTVHSRDLDQEHRWIRETPVLEKEPKAHVPPGI